MRWLLIPTTLFTPSILSDAAALRGAPYRAEGIDKSFRPAYKRLPMLTLFPTMAGTPRTGASLERLEPCEGKLSRTVLRGVWAG